MKNLGRIAAALLVVLLATPAMSQTLAGSIVGTVKDDQGGALPGVSVSLIGKAGTRTAITDSQGSYRFPAVEPGAYELKAELAGFKPKREALTLSISSQATIDFSLGVGALTETVEVLGETPVVDVTSSATNNQISQDLLFNMPLERRTQSGIYNYAPGINNASAYGGGEDTGNALLVDGVDTRDPEGGTDWTFYNYDMVEEIQIQGIGAPAEYGAFTGAIVNTVSKSGGNQFAGLFNVQYSNDGLASDNASKAQVAVNPSLAGGSKTTKLVDLTGQLSGPIQRDKLFFFASIQRYNTIEDPAGARTHREDLSHRLNLKVNWTPGPNDQFTVAGMLDDYNVRGRSGQPGATLSTDAQTVDEDAPDAMWNLQWRHLFSSKTFLEAKYVGWWGYFDLNPTTQDPSHFDGLTGAYTGGGGYYYYADRLRHEAHLSLSHYAEAWGKHDLKFGVQVERSKIRDRYSYVPGGYFYDYGGVPYYKYEYSYDVSGRNQRNSAYAQDSWKPTDRLTLNLGLRFDNIQGKNPEVGKVFGTSSLTPRLGFAFDLTGDRKTVLKGSYSQYTEGGLFTFYNRAVPGVGDFVTFDPYTGEELDRAPTPIYKVDPNVKHPRTHEYSMGFERALTDKFRLQITGIYRQNKDFITSVIPNSRWSPNTVAAGPNDAPLGVYDWTNQDETENDYLITNPNGFQYRDPNGNILGTAKAYRDYKGLMVVLSKGLSDRWLANASYVLAKVTGTVDSREGPSYGGGREFETPTLALVNADGESKNSPRHEFKFYATYQVPKIETGLNLSVRAVSGETFNAYQRYSASQIDFPFRVGREPWIEPKGSRRLDMLTLVDVRAEKVFQFTKGGKGRIGVYGEVRNLFNKNTADVVVTRFPSSTFTTVQPDGSSLDSAVPFGGPATLTTARQAFFGARWSF